MEQTKTFRMSVQMSKSIMMAFQKVISEQDVNILEIFDSFEIVDSLDGLIVLNPPIVQVKKEEGE